jgi:hypothetical protein
MSRTQLQILKRREKVNEKVEFCDQCYYISESRVLLMLFLTVHLYCNQIQNKQFLSYRSVNVHWILRVQHSVTSLINICS